MINFSKVQTQLLAIAYYSHWIIYRLQMIPINDGMANVIAFWLVYLIASHFHSGRKHFLPVLILSFLGPFFRISTFIILLVTIIIASLIKKWKISLWYLCLFILSLALFTAFLSSSIFSNQNQTVVDISTNISYFNNKVGVKISAPGLIIRDAKKLFLERIPRLYLTDFSGHLSFLNWVYLLFIFPPILYFYKGIKQKKLVTSFLSGLILSAYIFVFYTNIISQRYFLFTYIFSMGLFIKLYYKKHLGQLLVIGYISLLPIFSIYSLLQKTTDYCTPSILKQLKESNTILEPNAILYSSLPRHAYFFLNHPSSSIPLTEDSLKSPVYIVDTDKQIMALIGQFSQRSGLDIRFEPLLQFYHPVNPCSFGKVVKYKK